MTMKLTTLDTPDGPFTLLADAGVVLAAGWTADPEAILARLRPAERPEDVEIVDAADPEVAAPAAAVAAYYDGDLAAVDAVPVRQFGSAWRHSGWERLRSITPGKPLSYSSFAAELGNPNAVRAAASICATNAPALFVPCHRVLRGDGSLGGFAWGVEVKRSLLAREASLTHPELPQAGS
jgi:methylated-DNA-[protein]-cysteine S-methyltransferase